MPTSLEIKKYTGRLENQYKTLIEKAYNFKHVDSTISDWASYRATKLREKIQRIKFGN